MSASYTSEQSSYPRVHLTCRASSQRSHIASSMPCHGAWGSAPPIGIGAGNILGGEGFCQNFHKLAPKMIQRKLPSKKRKNDGISFHVGRIFSNQSTSSTNFAQISPNLPEKTTTLWFWVLFLWNQSTCSDFAKVFTHFAQISTDFTQIFTKSKVLGVRLHPLHPCLLHQWLHPPSSYPFTGWECTVSCDLDDTVHSHPVVITKPLPGHSHPHVITKPLPGSNIAMASYEMLS